MIFLFKHLYFPKYLSYRAAVVLKMQEISRAFQTSYSFLHFEVANVFQKYTQPNVEVEHDLKTEIELVNRVLVFK